MSTPKLLGLLVILVIAAGFLLSLPQMRELPSQSVSSPVQDPAVSQFVVDFGTKLKNVSLTASPDLLRTQMTQEYSAYLAPGLLEAWIQNPSDALGRQTSSPWPARIQVGSMEDAPNGHIVHGTVIEVVNGSGGAEEIVGTYPVDITVQNVEGNWRITAVHEGAYSQIPSRQTIVGTYECLPHRDTSGPQTTECAFGMKEDGTGKHYAINTQLMSSTEWMNTPTNAHIRVEGVVVPIEQLSTNQWQKYDIVGIISATTITRI